MRLADQPHHDGSSLYVSNRSPALNDSVDLWVRAPRAAGVRSVHVRFVRDGEPHFVLAAQTARPVSGHGLLDQWWLVTVTAHNRVTPYRFLLDRDGEPPMWLTAKGLVQHDIPDANDFRLVTFAAPPAWTDTAIVYEIFPDRFARSSRQDVPDELPHWATPQRWDRDPVEDSGPGTPRQFFGGDLDGIIEHLDHIQSLGADTIYLRPFFPAGSNHRYDASSFDMVDPCLGGDAALTRLSTALHARGMFLIGDLTTNHCGNLHEWFITALGDPAAPERDMFHIGADGSYASFWDVPTLPKLDWGSPLVHDRMTAVARRWMEVLDGWRIDVAQMTGRHGADDHAHDVARALRRAITGVRPDAALLAEHLYDASEDLDRDGWDGTMNGAGFLRPVWTWLRGPRVEPTDDAGTQHFLGVPGPAPRRDGEDVLATMREFSSRISWRSMTHSWQILDSFDTPRMRTVTGSTTAHLVAAGLQATMPGIPTICAGSEFGLTGRNGEEARTPMPWNRPTDRDETTLAGHRRLLTLRRTNTALKDGGLRWLHADADALVYLRETAEESALVLARRGRGDTITLPIDCPLTSILDAPDLTPTNGHVTLPAGDAGLSIWTTASAHTLQSTHDRS